MDHSQQTRDALWAAAETAIAMEETSKSISGVNLSFDKDTDSGSEPDSQPGICPTCNQKIVTDQPTSDDGIDIAEVAETAGNVLSCCAKLIDCLNSVSELAA
uniref:Uncharacterized LOC100186026 n=1 Tax=Ciona intestinalis TaxID=7719 RepID=H2XQF6_CIOIN|nr:uncharacterized protein LOC100186026 [Ciona intestinalis]|eukprot:XP_002119744.1 uncharacterized protein LOC100186026 [Ciona intestinalis]